VLFWGPDPTGVTMKKTHEAKYKRRVIQATNTEVTKYGKTYIIKSWQNICQAEFTKYQRPRSSSANGNTKMHL